MKKKTIIILMAILPSILFAQTKENFTVNSKIGTLNAPSRAYLLYQVAGKNIVDSVTITNGAFSFHGNVKEPASAIIVIDTKGKGLSTLDRSADALNIFLENGDIVLTSADSVSKAEITGSKLNDDSKKLKDLLKPITLQAKAIVAEAEAAPQAQKINPDFQNAIQSKYKFIQLQQETMMKKFISENSKSYVSLIALSSIAGLSADAKDIEPLFNSLSLNVKQTETGQAFQKRINEMKVTAIGSFAPDFTQADTSGTPIKLSSFRGKYVLLDFWASWCIPCRQENPNVVKIYNQYKGKNFAIVGVSLDKAKGKSDWIQAIKDDGLAWTQVSDLKYWANEAGVLYKISFIPQNYLIGPDGRIIAKNLKGVELESKLQSIFKTGL